MEAIIQVFSPDDKKSEILVLKDKPSAATIILDPKSAVDELGYKPKFDVVGLFEAIKEEMKHDRFLELRGR